MFRDRLKLHLSKSQDANQVPAPQATSFWDIWCREAVNLIPLVRHHDWFRETIQNRVLDAFEGVVRTRQPAALQNRTSRRYIE